VVVRRPSRLPAGVCWRVQGRRRSARRAPRGHERKSARLALGRRNIHCHRAARRSALREASPRRPRTRWPHTPPSMVTQRPVGELDRGSLFPTGVGSRSCGSATDAPWLRSRDALATSQRPSCHRGPTVVVRWRAGSPPHSGTAVDSSSSSSSAPSESEATVARVRASCAPVRSAGRSGRRRGGPQRDARRLAGQVHRPAIGSESAMLVRPQVGGRGRELGGTRRAGTREARRASTGSRTHRVARRRPPGPGRWRRRPVGPPTTVLLSRRSVSNCA
jgi:hypothetical protein